MQWFESIDTWQQALFASLFMFSMTALGAALVFLSKKPHPRALTLLSGSAAGIMIAASFFSLLLPALSYESGLPSFVTVTVGFLLGGGFIVGGDLLFSGKKFTFRSLGGKRNALLFLAVTLHNIPEGLAVGVAFAAGQGQTVAALLLAVGIGIQNFPEGMCISFPLRAEGVSAGKSFLFAQGSGAVEIPACILGALAASLMEGLLPWALAFSAGAMIAVVCSELIPECFSGGKTLSTVGIVLGFCVMMLLDVALG